MPAVPASSFILGQSQLGFRGLERVLGPGAGGQVNPARCRQGGCDRLGRAEHPGSGFDPVDAVRRHPGERHPGADRPLDQGERKVRFSRERDILGHMDRRQALGLSVQALGR